MRRLFITTLLISVSFSTLYAQQTQNNGKFRAKTDESGNTTYYKGDAELEGKVVICEVTTYKVSSSDPYAATYTQGNNEPVTSSSTYYFDKETLVDLRTTCGALGAATEYNFSNGKANGAYVYDFFAHGGTCDSKTKITGSYKNNLKDGEWLTEEIMDCGGLVSWGKWGRWLNGSHDQITRTIYDDGKVLAGPISYYNE
ncbi:MAG: hypothetical protein WCQ53_05425 [bacterium]